MQEVQETRVQSRGPEDTLEEEKAIPSSTLVWRMLWTEKIGCLQFIGSQRVEHDWYWANIYIFMATSCEELTHWKRLWCWEELGQEEKGMTEDEMAGWHQLRELVMDREAWCDAIHGIAKTRTRLSDWTELNWLNALYIWIEISILHILIYVWKWGTVTYIEIEDW